MSRLFEELKRRNVIRVAAAYVVASWVLLQIADVFDGILELPGWTAKLLLFILVLGFPLALVFAWAFEITPEGIKSDREVDHAAAGSVATAKRLDVLVILMVVLALSLLATDRYLLRTAPPAVSAVTTGLGPGDASVAVLPFENISQTKENEPFTIGIHDDLLTQISKIGSLKTISRASVVQFKDRNLPISQIASELGVATVMEGSVQRAGDMVRINVSLTDATTNRQLWAERYQRQLTATNIFEIQLEIVTAIAEALQAELSPGERRLIEKVPTESLAALEAYFAGRQLLDARTSAALLEAEAMFLRAVELDPEFALAWVGLSESYQLQEDAAGLSREVMFEKALPAIEKALELDEQLGPAYNALGGLKWTAGEYDEAARMFERSLELSPNYATTYLWFGLLLFDFGDIDRAISIYREGIKRDPLSSQLNQSLGQALEATGRFDEALTQYRKTLTSTEVFATSYTALGNLYWATGRNLARAAACHLKTIELDPGGRLAMVYVGLLFLDLGDVERANDWISEAVNLAPDSLEPLAAQSLLALHQGDIEAAHSFAELAQGLIPYYPEARLLQTATMAILRDRELTEGDASGAIEWYEDAYPELFEGAESEVNLRNFRAAIRVVPALHRDGEDAQAERLLERSRALLDSGAITRLGTAGFGIADVEILVLQGKKDEALTRLRDAVDAGWRLLWWFELKNNLSFSELKEEPVFIELVAEIEADVATQLSRFDPEADCR